jgi:hypothetical protein
MVDILDDNKETKCWIKRDNIYRSHGWNSLYFETQRSTALQLVKCLSNMGEAYAAVSNLSATTSTSGLLSMQAKPAAFVSVLKGVSSCSSWRKTDHGPDLRTNECPGRNGNI